MRLSHSHSKALHCESQHHTTYVRKVPAGNESKSHKNGNSLLVGEDARLMRNGCSSKLQYRVDVRAIAVNAITIKKRSVVSSSIDDDVRVIPFPDRLASRKECRHSFSVV
uniref:Uncharacterized protein n=1 Tax=Plectus sambesii TaxID=2011161 RepID=A0A914UUL8_9BILA